MKISRILFALSLLPSFVLAAESELPRIELFGSANYASVGVESVDGYDDANTTISVSLGGGYFFTSLFEGNLAAEYAKEFDGGPSAVGFAVGPTFNFSADTANAFYSGVSVGGRWSTKGSRSATGQSILSAFIGKRFEIASHVTWAPQILFTKAGQADTGAPVPASTEWNFSAFRLSIFL